MSTFGSEIGLDLVAVIAKGRFSTTLGSSPCCPDLRGVPKVSTGGKLAECGHWRAAGLSEQQVPTSWKRYRGVHHDQHLQPGFGTGVGRLGRCGVGLAGWRWPSLPCQLESNGPSYSAKPGSQHDSRDELSR